MAARCERIGKYVLPVFRSLIAEELVHTYNLTQVEAARRLGTTQAAISQYLSSKRALKSSEQFSDLLPKIKEMAHDTAQHLANKEMSAEEVPTEVCKFCSILCNREKTNNTASDYTI